MDMKPVIVIESKSDFISLTSQLEKADCISVDTESNSFYAYYNRICLIQVSTEEDDFIIDPIAVQDIRPLGEIFSSPDIKKVFHAASNDIAGLRRDFKFDVRNIFDTAIAAKVLGYQQLGLAKILNEHFGINLDKKWQRYDWGKRPLRQEQIEYARYDTHFLISLMRILSLELLEKQLWESAEESFNKACRQQIHEKAFRPGDFLQIYGAKSLDIAGKRVLQALYLFREKEARRRDRAPFRILTNETLVRLAHHRPKNIHEFAKIKGIPRTYTNSRAAYPLLELIRKYDGQGEDILVR